MAVTDEEERIIRTIQGRYKSKYYPKHKYQRILHWLRETESQIEDYAEENNCRLIEAALKVGQVEFEFPISVPARYQKEALAEIMDEISKLLVKDLTIDKIIVPEAWRPGVYNGGIVGISALGGQLLPSYNPKQGRITSWSPDRKPMIFGSPVEFSFSAKKVVAVSYSLGRIIRSDQI